MTVQASSAQTRAQPAAKHDRIWLTIWLFALTLFVLIDGLAWMRTIAAGDAPDEVNHVRMIAFLADNHRLPVLNKDIYLTKLPVLPDAYVTHPPGGYIVSALLSKLPGSVEIARYRYGSLFCILLAIPFVFLTARRLFPASLSMQLSIIWVCLTIPQVTFIGAYANPDAFGLLAGAIWIWATVCGIQARWTLARTAIWGAAAGLMLLGRYNGYILLPIFALTGLISLRRQRTGRILLRAIIALAACGLVAGWWLVFNLKTYHELLPIRTLWNAQTAVLGGHYQTPRDRGETYWSLLTRSIWLSSMFRSFFGNFSWLALPLPEWAYRILRWMVVLSSIGLFVGAVRKYLAWRNAESDRVCGRPLIIASFFVAICALLWFALHFALTVDFQGQGRYLFPGLSAIGVLMICGLCALFPKYIQVFIPPSLAVFFVALNLYALIFELIPYYKPLPIGSLIPQFQQLPSTVEQRIVRIHEHGNWNYGFFENGGHSVDIQEPVQGPILSMEIGVLPDVYRTCPGVRFMVSVHDKQQWKLLLDRAILPMHKRSDRAWQAVDVDMSRYVNQTTELRFAVNPIGDNSYDWAVWLNPRWTNKPNPGAKSK